MQAMAGHLCKFPGLACSSKQSQDVVVHILSLAAYTDDELRELFQVLIYRQS